ncbi:MAG: hypothetical protein C0417_11765 [Chlorobiaceae bacterium]|nr:hypothetical protein [Chlorobiaceae bacterium]
MNRSIKIYGFIIIQFTIGFLYNHYADAQSSYFNSRHALIGARAASLADALVAEAYDANTMYSNPAALVHLTKSSLVLNHNQERYYDGMTENVGLPVRTGFSEAMVFGLSVSHIGYLKKVSTTNTRPFQIGYDFAYAREIMPTFSVGARIGVDYGQAGSTNLLGASASLGICYSPSPEITYGAAFNGIGTGIHYNISGGTTAIRLDNLPHSLQAGVAMRYPAIPNQNIVTVAISNEKIFGQTGIQYTGGVEIYPIQFLAIRGGYTVKNLEKSGRIGFGVRSGYGNFDISISPSRSTDQSIFLTGSFVLWKTETRY